MQSLIFNAIEALDLLHIFLITWLLSVSSLIFLSNFSPVNLILPFKWRSSYLTEKKAYIIECMLNQTLASPNIIDWYSIAVLALSLISAILVRIEIFQRSSKDWNNFQLLLGLNLQKHCKWHDIFLCIRKVIFLLYIRNLHFN